MQYRYVSQQIKKISLNSKEYYRQKVASIHHFEAKRQFTTLLSTINMPLFKIDMYELKESIPTMRALQRIQKEHGNNYNILLSTWSTSDKKILTWKVTKTNREIIKETMSLLAKQNIFYYIHYHYLPTFYANQDVLVEQLIQVLNHTKCINKFTLGKLTDEAENNNLIQKSVNQNNNNNNQKIQSFPFEGTGNLCDILHNKMPNDIKYWFDFYQQNNPIISCSYVLYNNENRDSLYRDFKRIRDLNINVFDFIEFFNQISNDESKKEFYVKRLFKQFEYENEHSQKLLVKLAKLYNLDQIIQWIDLLTLIYEESYLTSSSQSQIQNNNNNNFNNINSTYPPLKRYTYM